MSGAFCLDLEKIEGGAEGGGRPSDPGPQLVEHNLEDILHSAPVVLPVTRTGLQTRMMSPDHTSARWGGRDGIEGMEGMGGI